MLAIKPLGLRLTVIATVIAISSLLAGTGGEAQVRIRPSAGRSSTFSAGDGTENVTAFNFASEVSLGFFRVSAGIIGVGSEGGERLRFGATDLTLTNSRGVGWSSTSVSSGTPDVLLIRGAAGALNLSNASTIGVRLKFDALPTIASGFGSSPSVTALSTPIAGSVGVGSTTSLTGTINFNGTAFPTAPRCTYSTMTSNVVTRGVPSTTQVVLSTTTAWTANDTVSWLCISSL